MIIDINGATNPHIASFLFSIQQLFYSDDIKIYENNRITHNSSYPYWSCATPAEIATIGTGMPIVIHLYLDANKNKINTPS